MFILPDYSVKDILEALLHHIESLELRIRGLYLDKGFCSKFVTEFLKDKPLEVIIACPLCGRKNGTRTLCKGRKSYFAEYTFYSDNPNAHTACLAVVRTYKKRHDHFP